MTTATHFPENRKPSFSLKKAINPVINYIVSIYDAIIYARQLKAATEIAIHLKNHNKDFRHMSHYDIVQQIMGDVVKERE